MPIKTLDPGLRQDDDYLSRQPMRRHPGLGRYRVNDYLSRQPMSRHPGVGRYRVNDYLSRQPMSRHPGVGRDPLFFSSEDTQQK
jgi:hypothetical protein